MLRNIVVFTLALAVHALAFTTAHAQWTPVIGIPQPAFGATEQPPALPSPWDAEVSGFYYVCGSCGGASASGNGTPSQPRSSLPSSVSPGSVIVLAGSYDHQQTYNYSCTQQQPCFLIGDASNPGQSVNGIEFGGSYLIIDGISFTLKSGVTGSTLGLLGDYQALRNSLVSGNPSAGGLFTEGSYQLVYQNQIVDNGNASATNDQDRHGIKVLSDHTWIVGNELARNSGDGVQVGDVGTRNRVHDIYIGDNVTHDNKQTGVWVKESVDVIVSSNLSYGHEPSGSSDGEGFGGQYDPQYVWMIFNESRDNIAGIGFKSSNNGGGTNFYVVGNYIHDNIDPSYNSNDAWNPSGIASWNSADITIVNNTLDGNSGGITLNGNTGKAYIYNNSIKNLRASGATAIFTADEGDVAYQGSNATGTQALVDTGMTPLSAKNPYQIFQSRYGTNIQYDFDGGVRPVRQWDIGAFESDSAAGTRPMAPSALITD